MYKSISKFFKSSDSESSKKSEGKPKEVRQILEEQIDTSLNEFNRSNAGLFMSAFTAGLEIGFSILAMGTIYSLFGGQLSDESLKVVMALCYSIGFIFVIIGRSELFTEHTALAILPVLNGHVTVKDLLYLWGLVYLGNLIGGYLFSFMLSTVGIQVGFASREAFYHMGHELVNHDWNIIFFSALLAGWMMGLLGWLVTSSQETVSRILIIVLVTTIIGLAGLHHCVVGSIEVFTAFLTNDSITLGDYLVFQFWATVGNAIGGTVFVAILKYSHIRLG